MFVCREEKLNKAYKGDTFMENVIKTAKEIAGKEKIPLYLPESEVRRLDREEAVQEGYDTGKKEMIINFYNNGISLDIIAKASKLTIENVQKIIDENKEK